MPEEGKMRNKQENNGSDINGVSMSMKQEGMFESMELSDSKGEYKNVKPRSR